ncbi:MAG: EutN/CcmL family microcompartment protein [Janthinobacterium lividum]
MRLGRVIGQVVSTVKLSGLTGAKLLVIEDLEDAGAAPGEGDGTSRYVAVDRVGAGTGEVVLVTTGSGARIDAEGRETDASVVAIVDTVIVDGGVTFSKSGSG